MYNGVIPNVQQCFCTNEAQAKPSNPKNERAKNERLRNDERW